MAETKAEGQQNAPDAPSSDPLEAALRERFGDEVGVDKFDEFVKREDGWLKSHHDKQQSLSEAEREAQENAIALSQQVAQHQMATTQPQADQQPQNLADDQFYQMLGAQSAGDVASAGQLLGVYRGMENTFQQFGQSAAQALHQRDEVIDGLTKKLEAVEPYFDAMHSHLANQKRDELMDKFPHADQHEIERAMQELPSGPDFENRLSEVAASSQKRIQALGKEAYNAEIQRRRESASRFRGEGGAAALAGEEMPSLGTRDGIKDFVSKTWVAPDGGDDI